MSQTTEAIVAAHTPGPWHVVEGGPYLNGESHWTVTAPHFGVAQIETPSRHAEANARLIASAPDLLDAAKMLVDWADGTIQGSVQAPVFAARQAINKAEGRS